ncbi:8477_t:CDS:2 [Paraglomus occultum]|uniref:8477_t:CDS:1 n=1 Tax=Paraglomus occultum TaxID=144539 RepID=A0A9N9AK94_9GLOM|nr:8477_t:CDS:2 [Paraglomus occultum]
MNFQRLARFTTNIIKGAACIHLFKEHVCTVTMCMGPSMLPTFNIINDIVAYERISPRLMNIDTGDVVVCISPRNPRRAVMKRVIGMPGDIICTDPTAFERRYITVPRGHVWLQGDNMSNSTDSREYGPVPYALIRGKVFARLWPGATWIRNGRVPIEEQSE